MGLYTTEIEADGKSAAAYLIRPKLRPRIPQFEDYVRAFEMFRGHEGLWATGGFALKRIYNVDYIGVHDVDFLTSDLNRWKGLRKFERRIVSDSWTSIYIDDLDVIVMFYDLNNVYGRPFPREHLKAVNGHNVVSYESLVAHWLRKLQAYALSEDERLRYRVPSVLTEFLALTRRHIDWRGVRRLHQYFGLYDDVIKLKHLMHDNIFRIGYECASNTLGLRWEDMKEAFAECLRRLES